MFEILVLTLLFLAVMGVTLAVYFKLLERRGKAMSRSVRAEQPVTSAVMIMGKLTPILALQSPISQAKRSVIQQELREAGFYHPTALTEYQAIRAVLMLLPLVVACTLALVGQRDDIPFIAAGGAVLAGMGFSLPRVYVQSRGRTRARQIERGLPVAIDLLNLCISGGQTINAALAAVSREITPNYPVLAEELLIVQEQAELSHLALALKQFSDRTNIPDVGNLAMVLSQTNTLGTEVSAGLLEYSNNLRTTQRQRAETKANRANFWMLFPTILCLWIPATLMLLGPAYFEFVTKRTQTQDIFKESRGNLEKTKNPINAQPKSEP